MKDFLDEMVALVLALLRWQLFEVIFIGIEEEAVENNGMLWETIHNRRRC